MSTKHKEKLPYLDLIRAISAVAIVLFHYSYVFFEYAIPGRGTNFLRFGSGDWGGVFVAVFFMISGAALWYNHNELLNFKDILSFWKKRWFSLFPYFYLAWAIMYIINSRKYGIWNWGGPRRNYLYTFFGMDGYFSHHGQNYYCLGEWFLGAIIWIYLFYPLLCFLFRKCRWPATFVLTFCYVFNLYRILFSSAPDTNIFIVLIKYYNSHITISDNMCLWTCFMNFWLGMIFITYREKLISALTAAISLVVCLPFLIFELPIPKIINCTTVAFCFIIMLAFISKYTAKNRAFSKVISVFSKYSYGIFLVHHVIIYAVMENFKTQTFNTLTAYLFFLLLILLILGVGMALVKAVDLMISFIKRPFNNK